MKKKILFCLFPLVSYFLYLSPSRFAQAELSPPKFLALTFDDGPRPGESELLRAVLARHQVHATFFVVGHMAQQYPACVKGLALEGHEIANHSWSHPAIRFISAQKLRKELVRTQELIRKLTGRKTNLFRPPGGTRHYFEKKFHVPSGFRMVLWDVHGLDQEGLSAQRIEDRVESMSKDGSVILLHNGLKTTTEAVDQMIPVLKARGFEFVTVTELLNEKAARKMMIQKLLLARG